MRMAANTLIAYTRKIHAEPEEQEEQPENFRLEPQLQESSSHVPAQLRIATHERIEIEIEINFPVRGGRINRTSSPLTSDMYQRSPQLDFSDEHDRTQGSGARTS